jgi:hypothetical protein
MWNRLSILLIVALMSLAARPASATLGPCDTENSPPGVFPMYATVNIYMYCNPGQPLDGCLHDAFSSSTSLITKSQTEEAIRKAIHIWNEDSGANVKLRYAGETVNAVEPSGVVLRPSLRSDCADNLPCSCPIWDDDLVNRPGALAQTEMYNVSGVRQNGFVRFFKYTGTNCTSVGWDLTEPESSGDDIVFVMIHELGHAVFGIGDMPDDDGDCAHNTATVMHRSGDYERGRVLKPLDTGYAQLKYGAQHRGWFSQVKRQQFASNAWTAPTQILSGSRPLFKPGSMSQNSTFSRFGLVTRSSTHVPADDGTGQYKLMTNSATLATLPTIDTMPRAFSVAVKPSTDEVLVVYMRRKSLGIHGEDAVGNPRTDSVPQESDVGRVCYRRSTDNFFAEVCNGSRFAVRGNPTVTYDPSSNKFVIGYISETGGFVTPTNTNPLVLWTVNPAGNSTQTSIATIPAITSVYAPSVVCSSGTYKCRVVFGSSSSGPSCVNWATFRIVDGQPRMLDASGADNNPAPQIVQPSPCVQTYDTPNTAWNAVNDLMVTVVGKDNQHIQAYVHFSFGMLQYGPAIFSSGTAFISSPAIGVSNGVFEVVYLQYW